MFKVGDRVKYEFTSGKVIYGTVIAVDSEETYCYKILYYDEDSKDYFVDEESEDSIELVEEDASVNDDTKFRAFLEEVANIDSDRYVEAYRMLEKIIKNHDPAGIKAEIEKLCDFYKNFTPNARKKMTVAEIEKELGYKIEVVE